MSANENAWQHYETDSAKGRAMWNLRPEALAEEMLVARLDSDLGMPLVHRAACQYVSPPNAPGIPFPGALLMSIYLHERAAYFSRGPRHAAFCLRCMVTDDTRAAA